MARRAGVSRTAGKLSKLREQVDAIRRSRLPDAFIVTIFEDDDEPAARHYLLELEAFLGRIAPETAVVIVRRLVRRPAGNKPPWLPPRRWLDPCHERDPPGGVRERVPSDGVLEARSREAAGAWSGMTARPWDAPFARSRSPSGSPGPLASEDAAPNLACYCSTQRSAPKPTPATQDFPPSCKVPPPLDSTVTEAGDP